MPDDQLPEKRYLRVDVKGQNPALWPQLRSKLIAAIGSLLDTVVDAEQGLTLREEAQRMTPALLAHARARLAKAGLENERIEAEVKRLYTQIEIDLAEARKRHAEADAIEFATAMKKLRAALGGTKAMLIGEEGEEAVVLGQQIEEFLRILEAIV